MEMWKGSLQPAKSHQQAPQQERKRHVPWIHAESHHQIGVIEEILAIIMMLSYLARGRVIEMIPLKNFIVANQSPMRSLMDRRYIMSFMIQVGPCT